MRAEERVLAYFVGRGCSCIARNFRWKGGELDLILRQADGELVFVEVRSASVGNPLLRYSIGPAKRRHLIATAQTFLLRNPVFRRCPFRFDLVWVEKERLEHWKNVLI